MNDILSKIIKSLTTTAFVLFLIWLIKILLIAIC